MGKEERNPMGSYGTFEGYNDPSQPSVGFPQPIPPPSVVGFTAASVPPPVYGYHQALPVYGAVAEGRPLNLRMQRLPCCGMGIGWFLFIMGFFFAAVPWYVGAFVLFFARIDYREKPGFIACTVAAVITAVAVTCGLTNGAHVW